MADTLKERKIYRILTNSASKAWDKIAFWTTAKSVDAADGNNLETKVGAIKGITTSTNTTTTGYAADATTIKALNDSLQGFEPVIDSQTGKMTGYKTKVGADTVFPFSGAPTFVTIVGTVRTAGTSNVYPFKSSYVIDEAGKYFITFFLEAHTNQPGIQTIKKNTDDITDYYQEVKVGHSVTTYKDYFLYFEVDCEVGDTIEVTGGGYGGIMGVFKF